MSKEYYSDKKIVRFSVIGYFVFMLFMSIAGGAIEFLITPHISPHENPIIVAIVSTVVMFIVSLFFLLMYIRQIDYKLEIHEDKIIIINDLLTFGKTFYWKEVKSITYSIITRALNIYTQTGDLMQIRKIMTDYEKVIDEVLTIALAQNPQIKIDAKSKKRLDKLLSKQRQPKD